jgi:hypothetical protein
MQFETYASYQIKLRFINVDNNSMYLTDFPVVVTPTNKALVLGKNGCSLNMVFE